MAIYQADIWRAWNQEWVTINANQTTAGVFYAAAENVWRHWNRGTYIQHNRAIGTGAQYINPRHDDQWIWTTANTTTIRAWEGWNEVYEENAEQKAARELRDARSVAAVGAPLTDRQRVLLTDDELRAWEDLRQRREEERLERERAAARDKEQWQLAEARAEELLLSLLDAEAKREWLEFRRVSVLTPAGRLYRLYPVWAGGVVLVDADGEGRQATLCVHPRERLPDCDVVVANMLALQHDEELMLQVAIVHGGVLPEDVLEIRRRGRPVNRNINIAA